MRINTALILCAGFGKRLNPVTLAIPKPLLKIDNITRLPYLLILPKLRINQLNNLNFINMDAIRISQE